MKGSDRSIVSPDSWTWASNLSSSASSASLSPPPISSIKRRATTDRRGGPTAKRRKPMGRPKNGWTASRKRKLVRLYLMTDLDINELAATLRSERFKPCKRDIQKQLNSLLQARPNQVRSKGEMTKVRLRLLRECKSLQSEERSTKSHPPKAPPSSNNDDDLTSFRGDSDPSVLLLLPTSKARSPCLDVEPKRQTSPGISKAVLDVLQVSRAEVETVDRESINTRESDQPLLKHEIPMTLKKTKSEPAIQRHTGTNTVGPQDVDKDQDDSSIRSSSAKSTHSVISLSSLKKRLHFKYSASDLGDIKSLLGRLTISRSSESSSATATGAFNKPRLSIPTRLDHPVVLPGVFPQYCWEHICHSELVRCDGITLPCSLGPIYRPVGTETHRSIHPNVLIRIRTCRVCEDDIDDVDTFGNSVLHIAATLGAPPSYLTYLVSIGADVLKLNNADQTFLHLVDWSDVEGVREFPLLFGALVRRGFNFEQQDHNGQTALHSLTQHPKPWKVLSAILQSFQFHGIDLPRCRDNRGLTVAEQLRSQGFRLQWPWDDHGTLLTATGSESFREQQAASVDDTTDDQTIDPRFLLSLSPGALQEYERHAPLLRTIVLAGEDPAYEDSEGRNGLHCLAEVRLELPTLKYTPDAQLGRVAADPSRNPWEASMERLLLAGVDPNWYDKYGYTPLMAFIIHWRDKDEWTTTTLLKRLVDAGANIHRRNRLGETPLHIAVKLGHRAATKFLLSCGANVHARTSTGHGILSLGIRHSNQALKDDLLYAQISLCICLVANAGAMSAPTILWEWGSPDFQLPPDRRPQVEEKKVENRAIMLPLPSKLMEIVLKW